MEQAWANRLINEDGPCVIREIIMAESGEATMLEVAEKWNAT
jgi:hypothetical protein